MSSLNIIKKYPELLELAYLSEREREHDLHAIFKRDIEDNCQFSFRGWRIYPIKTDGEIDMARLFKHLTMQSKRRRIVKQVWVGSEAVARLTV